MVTKKTLVATDKEIKNILEWEGNKIFPNFFLHLINTLDELVMNWTIVTNDLNLIKSAFIGYWHSR